MRRVWRAVGAAVPLAALACGIGDAEGAGDAVASRDLPALASARSFALESPPSSLSSLAPSAPDTLTFEGDGYALRYPADATLGHLDPALAQGATTAIEIRGPALHDDAGNPIEGSASYVLEVATYADTSALGLDAWVKQNGDREHDDEAESNGVDVGSAPTSAATVAGLPARRQSLFGGDCELVRYYVAKDQRVVVFRYADYPVANDPLNPENVRTYHAVMRSFRWTKR